jgi:UDP-N-acetylmuramoylalanine--D-glutamate ligase
LLPVELVGLRGEHNLLNVLAACAIGLAAGFESADMQASVAGFGGVSHRLEAVRHLDGVQWYNDSIATAPERAMAAIRSFDEPLILLAGGRDKNLPWGDFAALALARRVRVIAFGEAASLVCAAVEAAGGQVAAICRNLEEAVGAAHRLARPGDVVLLSPGGTSFDEFRDFEARGEAFRKWVNQL